MAHLDERLHRRAELLGPRDDLRQELERRRHAVGAHFHDTLEQLAMTDGARPYGDLEWDRRETVGSQPLPPCV